MKGRELLDTYPKVAKIIKEWFTDKMLKSMSNADDIPEDFKNHMKERGASDEFLINVIDKNPSALFEIFDSMQVYIGIVIDKLPDTEQIVFNYYICPKGECLESSPQEFVNRKDVDHYAMLAAIEYINNNIDEI